MVNGHQKQSASVNIVGISQISLRYLTNIKILHFRKWAHASQKPVRKTRVWPFIDNWGQSQNILDTSAERMWDSKEHNLFVYFSGDMAHDSDNGLQKSWYLFAFLFKQLRVSMGFPGGKYKRQSQSLGQKNPLEKGITTHSSILAWEKSRTKKPGGYTIHWVTKSWTQMSI